MKRAKDLMQIFGDNVKAAIAGEKVMEIARSSGVHQRTIYKYMRVEVAAQLDKIELLSRALKVCAWQLLLPDMRPSVRAAELDRLVRNYLKCSPEGRSYIAKISDIAAESEKTAGDVRDSEVS